MAEMTRKEAEGYARRIRNEAKRSYALAWIKHVFDGAPKPPDYPGLSYMGAQAVRMMIGASTSDDSDLGGTPVTPTVKEVARELRAIYKEAKRDRASALYDEEGLDVRLQVLPNGAWLVHYGDPGYDTDHRGWWGAASLSIETSEGDFEAVAQGLIAEVEDAIAQGEGGDEDAFAQSEDDDEGEDDEPSGYHDCDCCGETIVGSRLCAGCKKAGCEPNSEGVYDDCQIPRCPECDTPASLMNDGKWHSNCDDSCSNYSTSFDGPAAKKGRGKASAVLKDAEAFFYKHAGYSYDPKKETKEQGRRSTAKLLARAEAYAKGHDWQFDWDYDLEPYDPGDDKDYVPKEVLCCTLMNAGDKTLASLCGIADPDRNYRRVVEAELALEAMGPLADQEEFKFGNEPICETERGQKLKGCPQKGE